jgi:hypothetical protein
VEDKNNHENMEKNPTRLLDNEQGVWKYQAQKHQKENGRNYYILSKATLNVNSLNSLMKKHRLSDYIKKQDWTICCL